MKNTLKPLQDERHKPLNFSNPPIRSRSYSEKPITSIKTPVINNPLRKSFKLSSKYFHDDMEDKDYYENNERIYNELQKKPLHEYSTNEVNQINEWNYDLSKRKVLFVLL